MKKNPLSSWTSRMTLGLAAFEAPNSEEPASVTVPLD